MSNKFSRHTYSYLALRNAIGWIGTLLPFVLIAGIFLFSKEKVLQNSISHYYYTNMGDVFVGALCAIALFMFFYSGYDKWDDWAGNAAGIFALGVAWFPTTETGPGDWIGTVHFICAAALFIMLAFFSIYLFTKTKKDAEPTQQKLIRNKIYISCGIIMVLCLAAIFIYMNFIQDIHYDSTYVYWMETIALVAFGISWLTKGETLLPDKN
jgi:hypothetical protein